MYRVLLRNFRRLNLLINLSFYFSLINHIILRKIMGLFPSSKMFIQSNTKILLEFINRVMKKTKILILKMVWKSIIILISLLNEFSLQFCFSDRFEPFHDQPLSIYYGKKHSEVKKTLIIFFLISLSWCYFFSGSNPDHSILSKKRR